MQVDVNRMVQAGGADVLLVGTGLMERAKGWRMVKRSAKELWPNTWRLANRLEGAGQSLQLLL